MIASTTKSGDILLWHSPAPERWGAFAGGFEEVDENIEYDEREDEFDIVCSVPPLRLPSFLTVCVGGRDRNGGKEEKGRRCRGRYSK